MNQCTLEQQIERLRPAVVSGLARHLHHGLLVFSALLAFLSIVLWSPIPLMAAAFFALIGFAETQAGPNIEDAIRAYDSSQPTLVEVEIFVDSSGDGLRYVVKVCAGELNFWQYEFVPQGWSPKPGTFPAKIWKHEPSWRPILCIAQGGLLIPRNKPTLTQAPT
jgi:hypothetical protein